MTAELSRQVVDILGLDLMESHRQLSALSDVGSDELVLARMSPVTSPDVMAMVAELRHERRSERSQTASN
jgi:hypothetical protein